MTAECGEGIYAGTICPFKNLAVDAAMSVLAIILLAAFTYCCWKFYYANDEDEISYTESSKRRRSYSDI